MNNPDESLEHHIQSLLEVPFWVDTISGLFDLVGFILVLIAIIYIFTKIKAPGSTMMLIGTIFGSISVLIPVFITYNLDKLNASQATTLWTFEIFSSFFLFLAAIGFLRFAVAQKLTKANKQINADNLLNGQKPPIE